MTPALFAPGIVSTDAVELNTVFTPDLKEMFFARAISDYCPFVTPDGKYFFFSRRQGTAGNATAGDVYWMDAKFLEQFRR
jgi:hypothetical protein